MPEHIQYQDDDLFNPETHHEESDVPIKPLFWAVAIFIAFAIVTHLALAAMFQGLAKNERKRMDPPATQVARPADADVPRNQPLLQPFPLKAQAPNQNTPVTDLAEMRAREQQALHTYGWVDQQKGVVRIPIEEAKKLVVQRITGGAAGSQPAEDAGGLRARPSTGAPPQ
jgi:hypothetical protein